MNPFDLDATGLMVWGLVAHLIADWPLQNDWIARNKTLPLHPALTVHGAIHAVALAPVLGWPALIVALVHMAIDTRTPVAMWSTLVRQTQPGGLRVFAHHQNDDGTVKDVPLYDVGTEVRFWTDQVFHIATIAASALAVGALT
jgi:hypothetical protein